LYLNRSSKGLRKEWLYENAMRTPLTLLSVLICTQLVVAQVKIGDNPQTLDSASLLELESNSKVLVISRMTEAEMQGLSPLQGAMVYNTDASCIFYFDGTNWNNLCAGGNTESISWGSITGTLTDQADLAAEFQNYVDLANTQSIAGEKTFLTPVKGQDGIAPEDFVTKAQLDASGGGGGGGTWGSITGTLTNQLDLAAEFQNYVDLLNPQSIAGVKTFRGTWGSITGTLTNQMDLATEFQNYVDLTNSQSIAGEKTFLAPVKGEDGTADEDFVTRRQLDLVGINGHIGTEGSIFFAGPTTAPIDNNEQLFWDNSINQLRVGNNPQPNAMNGSNNSTLSIKGSVSKPIIFGQTGLNERHHTTIIDVDAAIFCLAFTEQWFSMGANQLARAFSKL